MTHLDSPSALDALREEAAIEPDPVHDGEVTKETQVIAIYGKGGSGKSFALSKSATGTLACGRVGKTKVRGSELADLSWVGEGLAAGR